VPADRAKIFIVYHYDCNPEGYATENKAESRFHKTKTSCYHDRHGAHYPAHTDFQRRPTSLKEYNMNLGALSMTRRHFLGLSTAALAGTALYAPAESLLHSGKQAPLPLWHGFNLLEKFMMPHCRAYEEKDFAWIQETGFNFVRLPMDYRHWTDPDDWTELKEEVLREIDEAVQFGERYNIHVCINFHRAPGYTVAQPGEEKNLWDDREALETCALHWRHFARRYAGIPNDRLSFNLLNEPALVTAKKHYAVIEALVQAIRNEDANRLIICDGRLYGKVPPDELMPLGIAASTRGYEPFELTHYHASWVQGADQFPLPSYPLRKKETLMDKSWLKEKQIAPWKAAEEKGMPVMVGEFGAFNQTPHSVTLAWMQDCLELWKEAGWGWALWNFRGAFGILDSGRSDVAYEAWNGHQLDRAMLSLLQRYL